MIEAVIDIEDKFWKCIYVLLCALFFSLKALRLSDTSFPGMNKIYYFVHCACAAVADETLFGPIVKDRFEIMASEADEVFGDNHKCIGMIEL